MTNRDEINRMSNKELASVLADLLEKSCADNMCLCYEMSSSNACCGGCSIGIENWLGLPCKDEEENPPAENKFSDKADKPQQEVSDSVNHPSHYTFGKIEVLDFIEDKKLGFHLGNAVKYISRAGRKDPAKTVEDLRKAAWYLNRQIERLEREFCGHSDGSHV